VAAGFERDVGGGAFGRDASRGRLFEGHDLCVVAIFVEVRAFADDLGCVSLWCCLDEDAAYLWVGRGEADGLGGQVEGALHEELVLSAWCVFDHNFKDNGSAADLFWRHLVFSAQPSNHLYCCSYGATFAPKYFLLQNERA
jgi:hypothetical protein